MDVRAALKQVMVVTVNSFLNRNNSQNIVSIVARWVKL